uniref:Uncharacterized protein n=1 Tax=Oryza nivara TaxID=4536 RepID=A0A0E0HSA0_ORYNI
MSSLRVGRVWLYDADPANTGVELIVGVPDECLAAVSTPCGAASWVRSVIQPGLPAPATRRCRGRYSRRCSASTKHSCSSDSTSRWSSPTTHNLGDPTGVELEYALLEPTYVGIFTIVQPSVDVRKLLAIVTAWVGCYLRTASHSRRGSTSPPPSCARALAATSSPSPAVNTAAAAPAVIAVLHCGSGRSW